MSYGISETLKGFAVCLLQEDREPLMLATKPFEYPYQAVKAQRILTAEQGSPLAGQVASALRRAEIFEPMVAL